LLSEAHSFFGRPCVGALLDGVELGNQTDCFSMLLYGGGVLGLPLLRRERVRLELEAGYGFGAGASTKWWHGPEAGVFLDFAGEPTPWSSLPPWYGVKLSAQQWFVGRSLANESSLFLGFSLVYRVQ
jgi:hypothetical protein